MTLGLIVKADNTFEYVKTAVYNDLRKAVGGMIEAVRFGRNNYFCYINEEGKLLNLPVNNLVTSLWYDSGQIILLGDYIAGDAIFFGGVDEEGNDLDIPKDFHKTIEKYI